MNERDESSGDVIIEEKAPGSDEIIVKRMENTESKGADFDLGSTVKEMAQKTGEVIKGATQSIGKAIESALSARDHVVMVRVNDDSLQKLDALVQSGIFKSRSEAAAFLISEGIKTQGPLFERIEEKIREIARLRSELKDSIKDIS
ncbi:MAG TPA: hypothetical protein VID27_12310 [Blastocatellia bacterium]|jgi:Arc/MetJ-type ribon-helix-helix transcriptional regulator